MGSIIHPAGKEPGPEAGPWPAPLSARRLEAVLTVDGPAASRNERDLRQLAAVAADHVVHHPGGATGPVLLAASVPAVGAPARLVLQSARLVELLLAG